MTARRGARYTIPEDYYRTPGWAVQRALDCAIASAHDADPRMRDLLAVFRRLQTARVLDPSAGGDPADRTMPYPHALVQLYGVPEHRILTVDKRPDSSAAVVADFLDWTTDERFDLILTNPPFTLAEDFVTRAWELLAPGGVIMFLQRSTWSGSQGRIPFFQRFRPQVELYEPRRVQFGNHPGGGDACEYSHFLFPKPHVCNGDEADPRCWRPAPSPWTHKRYTSDTTGLIL